MNSEIKKALDTIPKEIKARPAEKSAFVPQAEESFRGNLKPLWTKSQLRDDLSEVCKET